MESQFEFESPEEELEFQRESLEIERARAQLEIDKQAAETRDKLTLQVGTFIVAMPFLSYVTKCVASWYDKVPPQNGFLYDLTMCVGMLAILALQCPSVIPVLKEFFIWSAQFFNKDK